MCSSDLDGRAHRRGDAHLADQLERARPTGRAVPDFGGKFVAGRQIPAAEAGALAGAAPLFVAGIF